MLYPSLDDFVPLIICSYELARFISVMFFPDNVDIEPKQVAPMIMRDTAGNDDCHAKRVMNAIHHVNLPFHQKRQVGRNCANGVYRKVWTQTKI